jgi:protein-S-isoprenylcysteine O-methyltransferase Ste14
MFSIPSLIQATWAALGALWAWSAMRPSRAGGVEVRQSPVLHYTLIGLAFVLLFSQRLRVGVLGDRWLSPAIFADRIGLLVVWIGVAFASWARLSLGDNWSSEVAIRREHGLIGRGPYSVVRHPIYAGLLVAMCGTALVQGEVRGLLAIALAIVAWGWKSRQEERLLTARFGDDYERYRRSVKAFIPYVW